GKGCIVGLELEKTMSELHLKLISEGLICNCTSDVVIRFLPPYIITKSDVDSAIKILDKVFASL
ncbi:MAG: aminotransferase class III-fold pyridoxal phosphate-dependent enzyme, partial [Vampirovibrionia bacterium]